MTGVEYPPVSVVMPVRNEERHLAESVRHVLGQDYPGPLELVLAVGPSADRTEQIARGLAAAEPRITVVANPSGRIAAALNLAVSAARHQVIARIDGHALFPPGYLRTAIAVLAQTGAADVGGVMAAEGETPFQQAVAWGMTSKAGVGSAGWHTGGQAGPADTVYLGVYRREMIEQAGGWDEEMLRAEDWELNYRIRAGGGLVWFTPELQVTYRPRTSLRALGAQYFHYGRWRRVIMREHPETAGFRYLAPPGAVVLVGRRPAGRRGRPGRDRGRGPGRGQCPDRWAGHPAHLPGRDQRGQRGPVPGSPGRGARPAAPGRRRHAHVLGRRFPDQPPDPAPGPESRADRGPGERRAAGGQQGADAQPSGLIPVRPARARE